jgi:hypothetical protein
MIATHQIWILSLCKLLVHQTKDWFCFKSGTKEHRLLDSTSFFLSCEFSCRTKVERLQLASQCSKAFIVRENRKTPKWILVLGFTSQHHFLYGNPFKKEFFEAWFYMSLYSCWWTRSFTGLGVSCGFCCI